MARFAIADHAFDIVPLRERVLSTRAGAYAAFEGWVRDTNDGRPVSALTYEANQAPAESEGEKNRDEAMGPFPHAQGPGVVVGHGPD